MSEDPVVPKPQDAAARRCELAPTWTLAGRLQRGFYEDDPDQSSVTEEQAFHDRLEATEYIDPDNGETRVHGHVEVVAMRLRPEVAAEIAESGWGIAWSQPTAFHFPNQSADEPAMAPDGLPWPRELDFSIDPWRARHNGERLRELGLVVKNEETDLWEFIPGAMEAIRTGKRLET